MASIDVRAVEALSKAEVAGVMQRTSVTIPLSHWASHSMGTSPARPPLDTEGLVHISACVASGPASLDANVALAHERRLNER